MSAVSVIAFDSILVYQQWEAMLHVERIIIKIKEKSQRHGRHSAHPGHSKPHTHNKYDHASRLSNPQTQQQQIQSTHWTHILDSRQTGHRIEHSSNYILTSLRYTLYIHTYIVNSFWCCVYIHVCDTKRHPKLVWYTIKERRGLECWHQWAEFSGQCKRGAKHE